MGATPGLKPAEQGWALAPLARGLSRLVGAHGFFHARPLYANSLWLLLTSGANYGFGFLFWVVVARLYSAEQVGIGAAILPAASLVAFLSMFGLGTGLIRFMSRAGSEAPALINQAFTLGTLASVALGVMFVLGLDLWSPTLAIIREQPGYSVMFVSLVVLTALNVLLGQTFVALRHTGYGLVASLIHGIGRIVGAAAMVSVVGAMGIVLSWTLPLALAVGVCLVFFVPRALPGFRPRPQLRLRLLSAMGAFTLTSYVAEGLWAAPAWVLPLVVVNVLGPEQNAYFVLAWGVAMLPFVVPKALATAMFAEGSHRPAQVGADMVRSLKLCGLILGPVVLALVLAGDKLLLLYGERYAAEGRLLLAIATLAVLPGTLPHLYLANVHIEQRLFQIILISGVTNCGTLFLSILLLPWLGILAPGVGLLAGHTLMALAVLPPMVRLVKATVAQRPDVSSQTATLRDEGNPS